MVITLDKSEILTAIADYLEANFSFPADFADDDIEIVDGANHTITNIIRARIEVKGN